MFKDILENVGWWHRLIGTSRPQPSSPTKLLSEHRYWTSSKPSPVSCSTSSLPVLTSAHFGGAKGSCGRAELASSWQNLGAGRVIGRMLSRAFVSRASLVLRPTRHAGSNGQGAPCRWSLQEKAEANRGEKCILISNTSCKRISRFCADPIPLETRSIRRTLVHSS